MDLPTQNVLASPDAFFWRGTLILVINACCILCGLNEQKCNLHTLKLHSLICKEGQCPLVDSCVLMSTHGVDSPPSALALHQGLNGNPYTTVSSKVTARNVVVVLQLLSHVRLFLTPWTAACQASLSITTPGACSNSSSWWCHPTISPSVVPFSSCLQSFPASGSFPMSQFFASGGKSIGVSALASALPMNIQDCVSSRIDWLDLLALQGTLKSLL